jgi:pyroglutamyl-peptidase
LFQDLRPVLALHFGVAADARGFRIETEGRNVCRNAVDAAGLPPLSPILVDGAPDTYSAGLPISRIVQRLSDLGLPVSISNDAGRYLCNAVLYHALHTLAETKRSCRVGFVHIPADLSGPPLSFEAAVMGGLEMIRASLT